MGTGTRIRWQNVAKVAAGLAACVALVIGLPAFLERPEPPPLPADVGLTHVGGGAPVASLSSARATSRHPKSRPAHKRERDVRPKRPHEPKPAPKHRKPGRPEHSAAPQPTPVAVPAPPPPAPSPPTPAPAPAYSPPPPAPAPTPVATSSSPAPQPRGGGGNQSGPSEFGFER